MFEVLERFCLGGFEFGDEVSVFFEVVVGAEGNERAYHKGFLWLCVLVIKWGWGQ